LKPSSGLPAGFYTVTIAGAKGCIASVRNCNQSPAAVTVASIVVTTPLSCGAVQRTVLVTHKVQWFVPIQL
jgi:hypothetical protein